MSVESNRSHESGHCPNCKWPLEIAAIKLTFLGRSVALFVCPNCGLAEAETPKQALGKLRAWISALEHVLRELKYRVQRS
jgi:hypothetical protein